MRIVPSIVIALDESGMSIVRGTQHMMEQQLNLVPLIAFIGPTPDRNLFQIIDNDLSSSTGQVGPFEDIIWAALNQVGQYTPNYQALQENGYSLARDSRAIYFVGEATDDQLLELATVTLMRLNEYGIDRTLRVALLKALRPEKHGQRETFYNQLRNVPWQQLLTFDGNPQPSSAGLVPDDNPPVAEPLLTYCYLFTEQDNGTAVHPEEDIRQAMRQTLLSFLTSSICAREDVLDRLFELHSLNIADRDSWQTSARIGAIGTARFLYPRRLIVEYCGGRLAGEVLIIRGLLPPPYIPEQLIPPRLAEQFRALTLRFDEQTGESVEEARRAANLLIDEVSTRTRVPVAFQHVGAAQPRNDRRRRTYKAPYHSPLCPDFSSLFAGLTLNNVDIYSDPNTWLGKIKLQRLDVSTNADQFYIWSDEAEARWERYWTEVNTRILGQVRTYAQSGMVGIAQARAYLEVLSTRLITLSTQAETNSAGENHLWREHVGDYARRVPPTLLQSQNARTNNAALVRDDQDLNEAGVMAWLEQRPRDFYANVPHRAAVFAAASLAIPIGYYAANALLPLGSLSPLMQLLIYLLPFVAVFTAGRIVYGLAWRRVRRAAEELMAFYRAVVTRRIESTEHKRRINALTSLRRVGVDRNQSHLQELIESLQSLAEEFHKRRLAIENEQPPPRDIWGVKGSEFVEDYRVIDRARQQDQNDLELATEFLGTLAGDVEAGIPPTYMLELTEQEIRRRLVNFSERKCALYVEGNVDTLDIEDGEELLEQMSMLAEALVYTQPVAERANRYQADALIVAASTENQLVHQALAQGIAGESAEHIATQDVDSVILARFLAGIWPRVFAEAGISGSPAGPAP